MPPILWKSGLVLLLGTGAGMLGGQSVIAGMAPPVVQTPAYPIDRPAADTPAYTTTPTDPADYQRIADACDDCSDFDLGYRYAAARKLRSTAECMDYSWSYQRGCLAYLREG